MKQAVGAKRVRTIETVMRFISRSLLGPYLNNNNTSDTLICLWMVNVEGEFRIGRRVMATRLLYERDGQSVGRSDSRYR